MDTPKRKSIVISTSLKATMRTDMFENFVPLYSIKEEYECDETGNMDSFISKRKDELRSLLREKIDDDYARIRLERIKRQRTDFRFYKDGEKEYPSSTSIISGVEPIQFDPNELKQYGSRGQIVHKQIQNYLETGKWQDDVLEIPGTKLDYLVVTQGSLRLSWADCNFRGFEKKYGKDFKFGKCEVKVINREAEYGGTLDNDCIYKEEPAIADFKSSSNYDKQKMVRFWKQLASYAKPLGRKVMVIIPLNPKNKSGFGEPVVNKEVDKYYNLFLQDRQAFREIYGI